jgi:hypothetical protein
MNFASWITGVAAAIWRVFLPLLKSELGRLAADPQVQAFAKKAVTVAANYVQNSDDEKHDIAVRALRQDMKELGKEIALGWAATIVQQAYERSKVEDPQSIGKK